MLQSRWRSKVLWAALAAQVISVMQLTGAFEALGIDAGRAGDVVAATLQLLCLAGILNNPTNGEGW